MYIDNVGCCKMLLICSTLVIKSSEMCRLLAAIIFVNITMGMGTNWWGCYFIPMSLFSMRNKITIDLIWTRLICKMVVKVVQYIFLCSICLKCSDFCCFLISLWVGSILIMGHKLLKWVEVINWVRQYFNNIVCLYIGAVPIPIILSSQPLFSEVSSH